MPAPSFLTWTGDADNDPRRPSTDDLGGDQKQNHAKYTPNPVTMLTAEGWNELVKQVVALGKMVPVAKFDVRYTAGVPAIYAVVSPDPDIAIATFTVTDTGTGNVLIEWPANTFPPERIRPNGLTPQSALTTEINGHAERTANGVRVRMFSGATAADIDFTINID